MLKELGRRGVIHLIQTPAGPDTAPLSPRDPGAELARCDALLARCAELGRKLETTHVDGVDGPSTLLRAGAAPSPSGGMRAVASSELSMDVIEDRLRGLEDQVTGTLARQQRLLARDNELRAVCDHAAACREMGIPVDRPGGFSFLHFVTGSLPEGNLNRLADYAGENLVLLPLPVREGRQPLIVMTTPAQRMTLETVLQQLNFRHEHQLPGEGTRTETLMQEQRAVTTELEKLKDRMHELAAATSDSLEVMQGQLSLERSLLESTRHFPRTGSAILITGWIPARAAPDLEDTLKRLTNGHCVVEYTAPDGIANEAVPVLLQHSGWLRPFQRLVMAYGLPGYWELEPTLLVAISYVLMFGMMFGDAGQGAILAAAGMIILHRCGSATIQDMGRVLILGGLSSIGFGMLYGSYFGIPQLKHLALWRDPLEGDPMNLMLAAIGMGVVIISVGLILNVINRLRQRDVLGGLLGRFGIIGILFYWGSLVLLTKYGALQSRGLASLAIILFLALPLLGWMLRGPIEAAHRRRRGEPDETGGRTAMLAESAIGSLEGMVVYLANTTSFVRLAAYAMSHAALLMAAFTVAAELKTSGSAGGIWGLLVIILGNLIAIVLEGVIAAVQALRLEYYEFFGKFFSGTGQPFTPFVLDAKEAEDFTTITPAIK